MIENEIQFFEPEDEYGWLSCLSGHEVVVDGVAWPTAEHWYQAQKFTDAALQASLRREPDPRKAKTMAKLWHEKRRPDWDAVKLSIMRNVLAMKFAQHLDLLEKLKATAPARLVERTDDDAFWGDGPDGKGENWIGRLLMEVRETMKHT